MKVLLQQAAFGKKNEQYPAQLSRKKPGLNSLWRKAR